MGQEISVSHFKKDDFKRFSKHLSEETRLLADWFDEGVLSRRQEVGGFELEAWLVDTDGCPAPVNEEYLALLGDGALYSPELSRFNVELNSTPRSLHGDALSRMYGELKDNWAYCRDVAGRIGADLVMIGILPTVTESMLTLAHMSRSERYRALNEQVMRLRHGEPLHLDIVGVERLRSEHHDVMLEAATTSFQVHLQVSPEKALAYYNTLQVLAAPMVAISANSPILFGRRLWQETRIPLFEQAVDVGGFAGAAFGPLKRVSFGSGYPRQSLMEIFLENEQHFPVLLPVELDTPVERLSHLRLQNGTIWRWNRPLIGFDEDGTPHLRIEHRVMAAGPTVIDTIANSALLFGLARYFSEAETRLDEEISFTMARDNFYNAAKLGLNAQLQWTGQRVVRVSELLQQILPLAAIGLGQLGCDAEEIEFFLSIIEGRLGNAQTGANWQLAFLDKYGDSMTALVHAYREGQNSDVPVHQWKI